MLVGLAITDSTTRAAEEALEYEDPDAFRAGEEAQGHLRRLRVSTSEVRRTTVTRGRAPVPGERQSKVRPRSILSGWTGTDAAVSTVSPSRGIAATAVLAKPGD